MWVGGDLGTVYIVGLCYFGVVTILFGIWLFTTRRHYLRSMLWYTALSCLALTVCTLMLGFNFSLKTRSDGRQIVWLRWFFYCFIYGLCGITQVLCEVSCQAHYYQRWITSLLVGMAFVGPAVASTSGDEAQRIVVLCLSAIPYTGGMIALWVFATNRRLRVILLLLFFTIGVALYALWYAIGTSGFPVNGGYNFVWESATYLILDALMLTLLPAAACVLQCPCAKNGGCGKKTDYDAEGDGMPLVATASVDVPLPYTPAGYWQTLPGGRGAGVVGIIGAAQ